ncbi:hypothetical protein HJC23_001904, partial [Cyclotella cryptica]
VVMQKSFFPSSCFWPKTSAQEAYKTVKKCTDCSAGTARDRKARCRDFMITQLTATKASNHGRHVAAKCTDKHISSTPNKIKTTSVTKPSTVETDASERASLCGVGIAREKRTTENHDDWQATQGFDLHRLEMKQSSPRLLRVFSQTKDIQQTVKVLRKDKEY